MTYYERLAKRNGKIDPRSLDRVYENVVERLIRERYTVSQELAALRQRDTKPEQFAAYNAYVENCKAKALTLLGIK